jgi:hypothetical protein
LTVAGSVFTIKTAALLWFLYGTLNNQGRLEHTANGPGEGRLAY